MDTIDLTQIEDAGHTTTHNNGSVEHAKPRSVQKRGLSSSTQPTKVRSSPMGNTPSKFDGIRAPIDTPPIIDLIDTDTDSENERMMNRLHGPAKVARVRAVLHADGEFPARPTKRLKTASTRPSEVIHLSDSEKNGETSSAATAARPRPTSSVERPGPNGTAQLATPDTSTASFASNDQSPKHHHTRIAQSPSSSQAESSKRTKPNGTADQASDRKKSSKRTLPWGSSTPNALPSYSSAAEVMAGTILSDDLHMQNFTHPRTGAAPTPQQFAHSPLFYSDHRFTGNNPLRGAASSSSQQTPTRSASAQTVGSTARKPTERQEQSKASPTDTSHPARTNGSTVIPVSQPHTSNGLNTSPPNRVSETVSKASDQQAKVHAHPIPTSEARTGASSLSVAHSSEPPKSEARPESSTKKPWVCGQPIPRTKAQQEASWAFQQAQSRASKKASRDFVNALFAPFGKKRTSDKSADTPNPESKMSSETTVPKPPKKDTQPTSSSSVSQAAVRTSMGNGPSSAPGQHRRTAVGEERSPYLKAVKANQSKGGSNATGAGAKSRKSKHDKSVGSQDAAHHVDRVSKASDVVASSSRHTTMPNGNNTTEPDEPSSTIVTDVDAVEPVDSPSHSSSHGHAIEQQHQPPLPMFTPDPSTRQAQTQTQSNTHITMNDASSRGQDRTGLLALFAAFGNIGDATEREKAMVSSVKAATAASKSQSPQRMGVVLKRILREFHNDSTYNANTLLKRARSFQQDPVRRVDSFGNPVCYHNDLARPNGMLGIKHDKSPFRKLKSIQVGTDGKKIGDLTPVSVEYFQPSGVRKGTLSYIGAPVVTWKTQGHDVPQYTHYVSLPRNMLAYNQKQLHYFPYFGEEVEDDVFEQLEVGFRIDRPGRYQLLLRGQKARALTPYVEDFLARIGCTMRSILFYLLEPVNDETGIYAGREKSCALDFSRESPHWREVFARLPRPTPQELQNAATACQVFLDLTKFSLWHIARKDVSASFQPTDEVHGDNLQKLNALTCRICHTHDCQYHGELRERRLSIASDVSDEASDTEDELDIDWPPQINHKKMVTIPGTVEDTIVVKAKEATRNGKKKQTHHALLSKSSAPLVQDRRPFFPCNHPGISCDEARCSCFRDGQLCEKYCSCPPNCERKHQGCRCRAEGGRPACWQDSRCECFKVDRECDPDLCGSCGADLVLDPVNRYDETLRKKNCQNVALQLGLPRRTILGRSKVHGFGLFAGEAIKRDEYIGEYRGEIVMENEKDRRGCVYEIQKLSYLFKLAKDQDCDSTLAGNKTRFINHAARDSVCNVWVNVLACNSVHRIGMYAKRDIQVGEELYFNYGHLYHEFMVANDAIAHDKNEEVVVEEVVGKQGPLVRNQALVQQFVEPDAVRQEESEESEYEADEAELDANRSSPAKRGRKSKTGLGKGRWGHGQMPFEEEATATHSPKRKRRGDHSKDTGLEPTTMKEADTTRAADDVEEDVEAPTNGVASKPRTAVKTGGKKKKVSAGGVASIRVSTASLKADGSVGQSTPLTDTPRKSRHTAGEREHAVEREQEDTVMAEDPSAVNASMSALRKKKRTATEANLDEPDTTDAGRGKRDHNGNGADIRDEQAIQGAREEKKNDDGKEDEDDEDDAPVAPAAKRKRGRPKRFST